MRRTFPIHTEFIELCKLLKAAGVCSSGGEAKQVIVEGLVSVDGQPDKRKGLKVRPGQTVTYRDEVIEVRASTLPSAPPE